MNVFDRVRKWFWRKERPAAFEPLPPNASPPYVETPRVPRPKVNWRGRGGSDEP